jgi:hypothetical protein
LRYWARLLLQAPLAQHTFEQSLAFDQACTGNTRRQTMSEFTFERRLPARNETVIDPEIGSEQRALGSLAKVLDRAESISISPVSATAASVPSNGR